MALLQSFFEQVSGQTIFFSFLLASLLFVILLERNRSNRPKLPPGPTKLPVIGNLHQLGNMPHISLWHMAKKYGPICHLQLGQISTIVVSSDAMAKEVMKTHDLALASRPQIFSHKHLFYGCTDIVFAPYGPYWRHVRKITILKLLSTKRVQSFGYVRKEEVARLINRITAAYPGRVDLSGMMSMYASDVLCRVALGRDFSAGGEYDRHGFQNMLDEHQLLAGGFSIGDFFPSMEWVNLINGMKRKLTTLRSRFDRLFDEVIEEHCGGKKEEEKDLVDVLLDVQKDENLDMPLTLDNVKALMMDMFVAGTDTVFITLDWAMTELIVNPSVMKKVQTEVRGIIGDKKMVEENDLSQMNYLAAVLKEVFRLHPPTPLLLPRESIAEVIMGGYVIPPKSRIFVNVWAMGRDPEIWKNPLVFEPERFIGSSIDFKGQDFEFIPFGAGRRICPGMLFAMANIELALAQLLHSFDWELPHGVEPNDLDMTEMFGITTHRIEHLMLTAKPRSPKLMS